MCVDQRKGKCGSASAPKKCLRRQALARNPSLAVCECVALGGAALWRAWLLLGTVLQRFSGGSCR